jgi:hypothetical protein
MGFNRCFAVSDAGGRPECRDPHIELYIFFVARLHVLHGSEVIAGHYLDVALRAYGLYRQSCDGFHRRAAWAAIQMGLSWLCQRRGRN